MGSDHFDWNSVISKDILGLHASKYGFYVHQSANEAVLGGQIGISGVSQLNKATVWMDSKVHQETRFNHYHAMSQVDQGPSVARALSVSFVNSQFDKAWSLQAEGLNSEALFEFGKALHTIQDATSPVHEGYQEWAGGTVEGIIHAAQELFDPGSGSALHGVTKEAYDRFRAGKYADCLL